MSGFTDKLIKDLRRNEKDAKRVGISRLAVLKETIEDIEDSPVFVVYFIFTAFVLAFVFTTYGLVTSYNRIPQIEEGIFQIFDLWGVSVEELNQDARSLSGVLENVEISFVELGEMILMDGVVYYSHKPPGRFFIVDEYWSIVYYYINDRLNLAYNRRSIDTWVSPITGICLLVMVNFVYKRYKIKYKEVAGL